MQYLTESDLVKADNHFPHLLNRLCYCEFMDCDHTVCFKIKNKKNVSSPAHSKSLTAKRFPVSKKMSLSWGWNANTRETASYLLL